MSRTGIRNDDECDYDRLDELKLQVMNRLRDRVSNWQNEVDRLKLLCHLSHLFKKWKLHLPRLEDTFEPRQMDLLIADSIDNLRFENWNSQPGKRFLDFLELSGYKDVPELDAQGRPDLRRDTAVLWAVRTKNHNAARELFRIYNSYDSNYYDDTGLTHFHVACRYGVARAVREFLEAGQDPNCPCPIVVAAAQGQRGSAVEAPLHEALRAREFEAMRLLLKYGASPNVRDSRGLTALHALCAEEVSRGDDELEFAKAFFVRRRPTRFDRPRERVDVDARDEHYNTPLHWALSRCHNDLSRLLLEQGANPNATNSAGLNALHVICARHDESNAEMAKHVLEISRKKIRKLVRINVPNSRGDAPLHFALKNTNRDRSLIEVLLDNGADPIKPGKDGLTPLHLCCQRDRDEHELVELLLEMAARDRRQPQLPEVSAQDAWGRSPLHLALARSHDKTAKLLLERGADPNVADDEAATPLHLVCKLGASSCYDLAETLFKVSRQLNRPVRVDARDHAGRTPLQHALANLLPRLVDLLLDHGAGCDFPSADHFDECFRESRKVDTGEGDQFKLRWAARLMIVVEHLRKRGYELTLAHNMTIMRLYRAYGLFQSQADLDARWWRSSSFKKGAEEIKLRAKLSLWDLVRMDPEDARRQLDYMDYFTLLRTGELGQKIDEKYREQCCVHLCEIMTRGFFIQATLDSFMQLVHNKVSRETGDMILQRLMNDDLYNVAEFLSSLQNTDLSSNLYLAKCFMIVKAPARSSSYPLFTRRSTTARGPVSIHNCFLPYLSHSCRRQNNSNREKRNWTDHAAIQENVDHSWHEIRHGSLQRCPAQIVLRVDLHILSFLVADLKEYLYQVFHAVYLTNKVQRSQSFLVGQIQIGASSAAAVQSPACCSNNIKLE
ncbi:unnamed protein product [Trichogramma brassicae]|uniref:Uncharacterized protein n=1 Tax=Trichogramma brassicae TaxID=86971 RepID=A0A6H5IEX1_9HYME|nr:unnamed protein product [Trichogramma brassicae]